MIHELCSEADNHGTCLHMLTTPSCNLRRGLSLQTLPCVHGSVRSFRLWNSACDVVYECLFQDESAFRQSLWIAATGTGWQESQFVASELSWPCSILFRGSFSWVCLWSIPNRPHRRADFRRSPSGCPSISRAAITSRPLPGEPHRWRQQQQPRRKFAVCDSPGKHSALIHNQS